MKLLMFSQYSRSESMLSSAFEENEPAAVKNKSKKEWQHGDA